MRVKATLLRPGDRVLAAVSGGADSVALLRWLHANASEGGWVVKVAHFQHRLRGAESDEDEVFVRELAERLALPFFRKEADTAAAARGRSLEETARELRYEFFSRLLTEGHADVVATAHTLDDQAETVLIKLVRGAGLEGVAGIAAEQPLSAGRLVRPLLAVRRAEVKSYLHDLNQPWREDSSNAELVFTRNRIRHTVVPLLRELNPEVDAALARLAEVASAEEEHWRPRTAELLAQATLLGEPVRGGGRAVTAAAASRLALDAARLQRMTLAERRRVLREAAARLGRGLSFRESGDLEELLAGRPGRKLQLEGGLRAERSARELRLESGQATRSGKSPEPVVCTPGTVTEAPAWGLRVTMPEGLGGTLRVWRPGDRVRLQHTLSDRKVKEILQRATASPVEKERWPVLEADGKIAWIQGFPVQDAIPGLRVEPQP